MYSDLVKKQNIDVFIYTDNNDFFYNDIQYFSENNKEKSLGIPANYDKNIILKKTVHKICFLHIF